MTNKGKRWPDPIHERYLHLLAARTPTNWQSNKTLRRLARESVHREREGKQP